MTKQEYTTWEQVDKETKLLIHSHLFSCSILHPNNDKPTNNRVMKEFHDAVCINNPQFPNDRPIFSVYASFFNWLQRGEHAESTYNIFNHVRAFKTWWNEQNKPSTKYYDTKVSEAPIEKPNNDGRRLLRLTNEKLIRTKQVMEQMDNEKPVIGSIGDKLSSGKKWTEFAFYKDCIYTMQQRDLL